MLVMTASFLLFSGAQAASAAGYGPGFDDAQNGGQGRIGAYSFEGRNVYCLQPLLPRPLDDTTKGNVVDGQQLQMSDDNTARVNWAISTHGQSTDPTVTSAVAMFVWSLAAPESYANNGTNGDDHYLGRVPEPRRAEVSSALAAIREGAAEVGARAPARHSGSLQFTTDAADQKKGTVALVTDLAGATGTAVLSGATFASTGTATGTLAVGQPAPIVVSPAALERGPVTVSGTAEVTSPSEPWAAKILLLHTPGAQLLGSSGGTVPGEFTAIGQDRVPRVPASTSPPRATPTAVPTPTRTAAPPRIPSPKPPQSTQTTTATPTASPTATTTPGATPSSSPTVTTPPVPPATTAATPTTKAPAPTSRNPAPTAAPVLPTTTSTQEAPTPSAPPTLPTSSASVTPTATASPLPVQATGTPTNTTGTPTNTSATATQTPMSPQPEALAQTGATAVSWPLLLGTGALVIGIGALGWGFLSRRRGA